MEFSEETQKAIQKVCEKNKQRRIKEAQQMNDFIKEHGPELSLNLKCVVTGQPLRDLCPDLNQQFTIKSFEQAMRDNGNAFVIYAGYGSRFDGDIVLIGISDDVIEEGLKTGRAIRLGNYM
jgi:hypothetical protein